MTQYEKLLDEGAQKGLIIKEKPLISADGRIRYNKIAIRNDISAIQKGCALAEELGHYHLTVGDINDQSKAENRKQEYKARLWTYNRRIGLQGIINGYKACCHSRYELAMYLEVTEEFLQEALDCYSAKYGVAVNSDNYTIMFWPTLSVCERFEL